MANALKAVTAVLHKHGWDTVSLRRKNHLVIKARHRTGRQKTFVCGQSPSDHRALRNFERFVARA